MQFLDDEARAPEGQRPRAFRLDAKGFLLTWPRCDMPKERALEILRDKFAPESLIAIVVGHETHEDGGDHLHAAIVLRSKRCVRDVHFFDLENFHGNYQTARNIRNAIEYVQKEGDFVIFGELPDCAITKKMKRESHLADIEQLTSEQALLTYVYSNGLSASAQVLMKYWTNARKKLAKRGRFEPQSFAAPEDLVAALASLPNEDKALLLLGPTGIGKTQCVLALAEGPVFRVTDLDDLRMNSDQYKTILFDDCDLGTMSRGALLHLLDVRTERSIKCRYSNGILYDFQNLILIGNSVELVLGTLRDDAAINRRIRTLQLGPDKLYLDELPL